MRVTAIKVQAKVGSRFSIFIDGKYSFSLSESGLLEHKLVVGQEMAAAAVNRLKRASSEDNLYDRTLRFVLIRLRSEWEIKGYLQRKKCSPPLTETILNKLTKLDLVNDTRFAQAWIDSRRLLRPTSKRKLQQELRTKHVSDEIISNVLDAERDDECKGLRELADKKRARYPDKLKLMQYLARQGYNYSDIRSVIDERGGT